MHINIYTNMPTRRYVCLDVCVRCCLSCPAMHCICDKCVSGDTQVFQLYSRRHGILFKITILFMVLTFNAVDVTFYWNSLVIHGFLFEVIGLYIYIYVPKRTLTGRVVVDCMCGSIGMTLIFRSKNNGARVRCVFSAPAILVHSIMSQAEQSVIIIKHWERNGIIQ